MVDSSNRCFTSPVPADASWGCSEVVSFRPLPQDSTGHIDLFAKLVSDKVPVVADFASDQVLLTQTPDTRIDTCEANGGGCTTTHQGASFNAFEQDQNGGNRLFSIAELKELLVSRYGTETLCWNKTISNSPEWEDFHLREFTAETEGKLQKRGFSVMKILNPPPIAYAAISRLVDTQGKVINETVDLKFAYRSFLNSLIVNNHVFMPTFVGADTATNENAKNIYVSQGFTVTGIPMDAHAFQDGAVHCLTHEIH